MKILKNKIIRTFALSIFVFVFLIIFNGCTNNDTNITNTTDLPSEKNSDQVNLTFNGQHVTCDHAPNLVDKNKDINLSLDIEYSRDASATWKHEPEPDVKNSAYPEGELTNPIVEYELLIDNIHVFIDNKEYNDAFTFMYQRNDKNTLTIKKEYVRNDIKIEAKATPRTASLSLYGYVIEGEDLNAYKNGDLQITFKNAYQNQGLKKIRTLSNGIAFPVFEDDDIDVTFHVNDIKFMPKNLWFRTNSRYALEGEEFFKNESDDGKTVHIYVPHYVVRDHGTFKTKEQ